MEYFTRTDLTKIHFVSLGDESQFYCAELQHWVHQHIENSELLVYPIADHSPHLWHRQKFIYDLNRFVDAL